MAWRGDYMVKKEIMQQVFQQLNFFPNLDIFATRTSKQCRRYFSPLEDRRAEERDAFQPPWTGESVLIHPPIEQIPRAIAKAKRDGVVALFILPDWALTKYYQMFPTILTALNFGLASQVLHEGKKMNRLQLKLPPGDLLAVLINTLEENQFTENQLDETWRKRRAALDELSDCILEKEIKIETFIGNKADIEFVNALVQIFNKGGDKLKQRIRKLRMHGCATLSQFSEMKVIGKSPLINQFSKNHQLAIEQKAKYNTMWNIQFLFNYIEKRRFKSLQEMQAKAMSLLVAFSAAKMVELVRMTLSDVQIYDQDILLQTSTTKGDKLRLYTIKLTRKNNNCCPIAELQTWINERSKMKDKLQQLWWNFAKQKPATSDDCSHILLDITRKAGVPDFYTGSSIRHAMMTRLRAAGASQQVVNYFTRHALNSTVVDMYYNRPIARDLSKLLIEIDQ
ncbi:MAG: hypothetical protein EZS28_036452, partial [Streblomastix strix]